MDYISPRASFLPLSAMASAESWCFRTQRICWRTGRVWREI